MSLDWDVEDVKDYKDLWIADPQKGRPDNKTLNTLTQTLIWATIPLGMGNITEENWKDFYASCKLTGVGSYVYNEEKDRHIFTVVSPENIKRHIGLFTNATRMTDKQFLDRIYKDAKEVA